jgi:hypothetical protein
MFSTYGNISSVYLFICSLFNDTVSSLDYVASTFQYILGYMASYMHIMLDTDHCLSVVYLAHRTFWELALRPSSGKWLSS